MRLVRSPAECLPARPGTAADADRHQSRFARCGRTTQRRRATQLLDRMDQCPGRPSDTVTAAERCEQRHARNGGERGQRLLGGGALRLGSHGVSRVVHTKEPRPPPQALQGCLEALLRIGAERAGDGILQGGGGAGGLSSTNHRFVSPNRAITSAWLPMALVRAVLPMPGAP